MQSLANNILIILHCKSIYNGHTNLMVAHFTLKIFTIAEMTYIHTSVNMSLDEEDRILIKNLHLLKGYCTEVAELKNQLRRKQPKTCNYYSQRHQQATQTHPHTVKHIYKQRYS